MFPLIVLLTMFSLLVVAVEASVSIPPKVLPLIVESVMVVVVAPLPMLMASP